ncbi:hypothetical protein ACFOKI_01380 [Sphingomonas qilianensis]|uniref:Uncharacterized protein n=1 Tax=Sphingomonas qilianensis TaxID=1736690 RepID=A0ABU9XSD1_9SPHN
MTRLLLIGFSGLAILALTVTFMRSVRQNRLASRAWQALKRAIERFFTAAFGALIGGAILYYICGYVDDDLAKVAGVAGGLLLFPMLLVQRSRDGAGAANLISRERIVTVSVEGAALHAAEPTAPKSRGWLSRPSYQAELAKSDQQLEAAWATAAREAHWLESEVAIARRSCRAFLETAGEYALEVETVEWAVFIRKHVPALVAKCLARCRDGSAGERHSALEALVDSLQQIGAEADRRRSPLRKAQLDAFDIAREHVARRTNRNWFSI